MKVIFDELEKEGILLRLYRRIFSVRRKYEYVQLTFNGKPYVIKRGVPVDIPIPNTFPSIPPYTFKIIGE